MTELAIANARLKASRARCSIQQRGRSFVLVATLPIRGEPGRKQQRISLGPLNLIEAERKAVELAHQLRTNTFSWDQWDTPQGPSVITIDQFRTAAAQLHSVKYRSSPERGAVAWSKKWAPALRKLPPSGVITESLLLRTIRALPEGSAGRRDQGNILAQCARSLGLDHEPLLAACRGYGVSRLTERDIPTDEAIEAAFKTLRLPHWRWTWGMCAAYGLRPHECATLTWLPEGDWIQIGDATKTGARRVTPCPSAWVSSWNLRELPRPEQRTHSLTKAFADALTRDRISIKPYNLRHAYALRLLSRGVTADLGARLMGHSLQVHQSTYQRWIEADRIQKALRGIQL